MLKKSLLGASIVAALGLTSAAYASDPVVFDADGTGGLTGNQTIGALDWSVGNAYIQGFDPAALATGPLNTQVYYQATLGGVNDTSGNPLVSPTGLNGNYEITIVAGFGETVTATGTGTVGFALNSSPTFENFFRIYYDDLSAVGSKSNALAGTGYANGTLILSGSVVTSSGNFSDALCAPISATCADAGLGFPGLGVQVTALDQSPDGNNYPTIATVVGNGSTQLTADVTFFDPNFFKSNIAALTQDLFFNTSNVLPFNQTNPSALFTALGDLGNITPTVSGTSLANVGVNGLTGPNMVLQSDGNNSFAVTVPEPDSVALMGIGLVGLAAGALRRRKTAA